MKLTRLTSLLAIGLVLSVAAVGCRKKPVGVENIPNQRLAHVADIPTAPPFDMNEDPSFEFPDQPDSEAMPLQPLAPPGSHLNWAENAEMFGNQAVRFDYDSFSVASSEKAKVAAVAAYLKANPNDAVRVEGHCDERGTEEYNRALGERRALAIREELIRLGIDAARVDTVSFGEDRPVNPEHNEAAWRENRRGEFIVLGSPNN